MGHVHKGGSDNDTYKGTGGNLDENKYHTIYIFFFKESNFYTFTFQDNTVFTVTSLVFKGHNVNSSLRY